MGGSGAISISTLGSASGCSKDVVAETKRGRGRPRKKVTFSVPINNPSTVSPIRKRGRPVGSVKKEEGSHNPSTSTQKRKRGRPVGSGRKSKGKEEHTDIGMLML